MSAGRARGRAEFGPHARASQGQKKKKQKEKKGRDKQTKVISSPEQTSLREVLRPGEQRIDFTLTVSFHSQSSRIQLILRMYTTALFCVGGFFFFKETKLFFTFLFFPVIGFKYNPSAKTEFSIALGKLLAA